MKSTRDFDKIEVSFWQIFRIVLVICSLALMRDAFYRWDGFSYYASFLDFIPNICLASIFMTFIVLSITFFLWALLRAGMWVSRCLKLEVSSQQMLFFPAIFIPIGLLVWNGKKLIAPDFQTSLYVKLIVLISVFVFTVFIMRLLRNRINRWVNVVQERITPLVWIFGIFIVLSFPAVAYRTLWHFNDKAELHEIAQPSKADKDRPNIILVTYDALTARDMKLFGYHRETTPFISEWSKEASLFKRTQAESNFTSSTLASLMTGKRVWTHQVYHISGSIPAGSRTESIPFLLRKNGYVNMAFIVNRHASARLLGMYDQFDVAYNEAEFLIDTNLYEWIDQTLYKYFGGKFRLYNWIINSDFILYNIKPGLIENTYKDAHPPEKAFNKFLETIDQNSPSPFFAWIHHWQPHDPYLPPARFCGTFDPSVNYGEPMPKWKGAEDFLKSIRARYNECILNCDEQFEEFIGRLDKRGLLKNSIIILSADHGESFSSEHNYIQHGGPHLYEQVTHIPLIIKEPGQTQGKIINDLVEQIDISATILDFAQIPVPAWMEGRSLKPLMRGEKLPPKKIFSMNFQKNRSRGHKIENGTIALWEGDYKLIHYIEKDESLLFDLKKDPGELTNRFDMEPEIGQRLLGIVKDKLRQANERIMSGN